MTTTDHCQYNTADLGYTWHDLRERRIGALNVGAVVVTLMFPSAYWTGGPDGQIASAFGMTPCGTTASSSRPSTSTRTRSCSPW
jgi:hypothetical protein